MRIEWRPTEALQLFAESKTPVIKELFCKSVGEGV